MLNSITSVLAASTAFTSGFVHPGRLASTALTSGNLIELDHHKNFNQGKFSKHAKFQKKQRRPSKQTKWQNDDLSSSENNEITSTLPIKVDPSILPTPSEKSPIISEHLLFGGASDISQTIVRSSYIVNYNKARKCANFVAEHISKESMKQVKFDRPKFSQDDEIDPMYRSIDADYLGSGFDRGHLVACGNHKESKRHYDDTFKFSNAVPQNHQMNTGKWNVLENWVRDTLIPKYDDLYIITGIYY